MTKQITTLVVDNEPSFVELAAETLERTDESIVVEAATSGEEALEALEGSSIDCIVSDYEMPGMDGLELLEEVRRRDPDLPFILFTGRGSEEIASDAIAAGVTQYLQKQPSGDQYTLLANQITNAVSEYRARAELRKSERRYERTLTALHETTRDLMRAETKEGIYREAVDTAGNILGVPIVAAYSFEPTDGVLTHAASTDETGEVLDPDVTFERGEGLVWEAFSEGEPCYYEDTRSETDVYNEETLSRSELIVPLGTHGVVVVGTAEVDGIDETMTELTHILAANTEAALDRAEREQLLREHDRTLTRQNEELTRLNHTNTVVREINRAVAEASTRREIEQAVCDRLEDTERYLFAWVISTGEVTPSPTAWDGVDATYIDRVRDDGKRAPEVALSLEALEAKEVRVVRNVLDESSWECRRKEALTYGYQTVIAVPLVDDERGYGALVVHAPQADAISDDEREVLAELGETIGHAIRSAERTRAMLTDDRLELEFECRDPRLLFNRLSRETGSDLELEGTVDREEDRIVLFIDVASQPGKEALGVDDRWETVEEISVVAEREESTLLEVTGKATPFVEVMREYDARLQRVTASGGETAVTVTVPGRVGTRSLVEAIQERYPQTTLSARRETTRSSEPLDARLEDRLTDRQLEALQAAYYSGFFEWPRESTGEDLADSLDVSPPTYHYHLRAAERKLTELSLREI
ncbi:bacterio-opsin activator domain-containing protein [Natrialbaceae archaeon A-gly3]